MMSDAVLQILLILAYLAIGLISITFPIYAICVTYLRQEKSESEKERKNRIEELRDKITNLSAELKGETQDSKRVTQLKVQIGRYERELKGTELRVGYLTAKGAVGRPITYLVIALLATAVGLHFFYEQYQDGTILFGIFSCAFSVGALYNLYKTISAVEYAALRPARTIGFEVRFESGKKKGVLLPLLILLFAEIADFIDFWISLPQLSSCHYARHSVR